jgi:hypothetical protein
VREGRRHQDYRGQCQRAGTLSGAPAAHRSPAHRTPLPDCAGALRMRRSMRNLAQGVPLRVRAPIPTVPAQDHQRIVLPQPTRRLRPEMRQHPRKLLRRLVVARVFCRRAAGVLLVALTGTLLPLTLAGPGAEAAGSQGIQARITTVTGGGAPGAPPRRPVPIARSRIEIRKIPRSVDNLLSDESGRRRNALVGALYLPATSPVLTWPIAAATRTDADGAFRQKLPPGRYVVLLSGSSGHTLLNFAVIAGTSHSRNPSSIPGVIVVRAGRFTTVDFRILFNAP